MRGRREEGVVHRHTECCCIHLVDRGRWRWTRRTRRGPARLATLHATRPPLQQPPSPCIPAAAATDIAARARCAPSHHAPCAKWTCDVRRSIRDARLSTAARAFSSRYRGPSPPPRRSTFPRPPSSSQSATSIGMPHNASYHGIGMGGGAGCMLQSTTRSEGGHDDATQHAYSCQWWWLMTSIVSPVGWEGCRRGGYGCDEGATRGICKWYELPTREDVRNNWAARGQCLAATAESSKAAARQPTWAAAVVKALTTTAARQWPTSHASPPHPRRHIYLPSSRGIHPSSTHTTTTTTTTTTNQQQQCLTYVYIPSPSSPSQLFNQAQGAVGKGQEFLKSEQGQKLAGQYGGQISPWASASPPPISS